MSSPKRAAKIVAKAIVAKNAARSAAKSAAKLRPVVARPPLKRSEAVDHGASADAQKKLIAAACRVYTARLEAGEQFMPIPKNSISATDVMVTASGLLKAADLAVFELGMWQRWTCR